MCVAWCASHQIKSNKNCNSTFKHSFPLSLCSSIYIVEKTSFFMSSLSPIYSKQSFFLLFPIFLFHHTIRERERERKSVWNGGAGRSTQTHTHTYETKSLCTVYDAGFVIVDAVDAVDVDGCCCSMSACRLLFVLVCVCVCLYCVDTHLSISYNREGTLILSFSVLVTVYGLDYRISFIFRGIKIVQNRSHDLGPNVIDDCAFFFAGITIVVIAIAIAIAIAAIIFVCFCVCGCGVWWVCITSEPNRTGLSNMCQK